MRQRPRSVLCYPAADKVRSAIFWLGLDIMKSLVVLRSETMLSVRQWLPRKGSSRLFVERCLCVRLMISELMSCTYLHQRSTAEW